jgi:hypothetical protein
LFNLAKIKQTFKQTEFVLGNGCFLYFEEIPLVIDAAYE